MSEYGRAGLLGVLIPQANTTVEPELWALLPPAWSVIAARLTSDKASIAERLVDYAAQYHAATNQFSNAPLSMLLAACTGASYLIGAEKEDALAGDIEATQQVPFVTAAVAATRLLREMNVRRIALLTPYPPKLNEASKRYWQSRGFEVVAKSGPDPNTEAFHPIYALSGAPVLAAYRELSKSGADAVLMLGTGMATLAPLLAGQEEGLAPSISCNLALAWVGCGATTLDGWVLRPHWAERARYLIA